MAATVGSRIRDLRKNNNWTQKELAKKANIAQSTVCDIEKSTKNPSTATIGPIASALGTTTAYLLGEEEEPITNYSDIEQDLVKRFRTLDDRGRETVNAILDLEYQRSSRKRHEPAHVLTIAAHGEGTTLEQRLSAAERVRRNNK